MYMYFYDILYYIIFTFVCLPVFENFMGNVSGEKQWKQDRNINAAVIKLDGTDVASGIIEKYKDR